MKSNVMLKCNGVEIPHYPKTIEVTTANVSSDDTGRNQKAILYQKIIRRGVQKVVMTFSTLTDRQISNLYNWTQSYGGSGNKKTFVTLTYNDPRTNAQRTAKGYFGAETSVTYIYDNGTNLLSESIVLTWIEV